GSSPITADARRAVAQRRLVRRRKRCQSASLPRQLRYLGRSFFVPFFSARFCKSMTTAACSRRRFCGIKKQMSGKRVQRKSAFVWQVVLILLPVVILAVIGWTSLRQDKILAEHDARQRAQAIADQLTPSLWTQLTSLSSKTYSSNEVLLQVDDSGALVSPPTCDPEPVPAPLPLAE